MTDKDGRSRFPVSVDWLDKTGKEPIKVKSLIGRNYSDPFVQNLIKSGLCKLKPGKKDQILIQVVAE